MKNETLKEKYLRLRSATDYKLENRAYVMIMLDGKNFSKMVKNKFGKPFDAHFCSMMDETARYLCKNVSGCVFAYVQSDEITLVIDNLEKENTQPIFGNRLCKIQSIVASLATSKFNQLATIHSMMDKTCMVGEETILVDPIDFIDNMPLYQFDCKAWNIFNYNDVFASILYRQIDCIRNSKQQTAQAYLPHKRLVGHSADEQIQMLKDEKLIDWYDMTDGVKYGRFLYKVVQPYVNMDGEAYERNEWRVNNAFDLTTEEGKNRFHSLNKIPVRNCDTGSAREDLKKYLDWLDTKDGQNFIDELVKKDEEEGWSNSYTDEFLNSTLNNENDITFRTVIEKLNKEYNYGTYKDDSYERGFEPNGYDCMVKFNDINISLGNVVSFIKRYKDKLVGIVKDVDEDDNPFPNNTWLLFDKYMISEMFGQGCVVSIWEHHPEYKNVK